MLLDIHIVKTKIQESVFLRYKVLLMEEIRTTAEQQHIIDKDLYGYNTERAQRTIQERDNYLISYDNNDIGMFQVSIRESICEKKEITYLHCLYLEKSYRNYGIGRHIINYIVDTYHRDIECECWYNMPAMKFYNSLKFSSIRNTLSLHYSDQNCISEIKK